MPSLRELQDAIRRSIIEHDDIGAASHIASDGTAPEERLSVYRNTFELTLIRALRLTYPAVDQLVGSLFFDAAAVEFIAHTPPGSGYLEEFGADFAGFLGRFAPAASVSYLADVARLEWAVNCALHAPDDSALTIASLQAVDIADYAHVCFTPHPSLGLVYTRFPADTIRRAVLDGEDAALSAIDLADGPVWLMVRRESAGVEVVRVDETVWCFVSTLRSGCALGLALHNHPGIDATATLADLLAYGCFAGFCLAPGAHGGEPSMEPL